MSLHNVAVIVGTFEPKEFRQVGIQHRAEATSIFLASHQLHCFFGACLAATFSVCLTKSLQKTLEIALQCFDTQSCQI